MDAEFKSNKAAVQAQFNKNLKKCLMEIGLEQRKNAIKEINDMGAVDTGLMRASNSFTVGEKDVTCGNTVKYAPFVALGTHRMRARPFLQNSILNYVYAYREIAVKHLGEGF